MSIPHLGQLILESTRKHDQLPAMSIKTNGRWQSYSYREVGDRIRAIGKSLIAMGVQSGDRICIFSPNRPEWTLVDLASLAIGAVTVPCYATNTAKQVEYIVNDSGAKVIVTGGQEHYDKVTTFVGAIRELSVITMDEPPVDSGPGVIPLSNLVQHSDVSDQDYERRMTSINPQDLATIVYTSGTTGDPKGVMLSHKNFFGQIEECTKRMQLGTTDSSLCFLPLSHIFERTWTFYILSCGAKNFYLENPKEVMDCMNETRTTVLCSVPRLYEKIYEAVTDKLNSASFVRKALFSWATGVGKRYYSLYYAEQPIPSILNLKHKLADKLVLSKIRRKIGGDKRFLVSGGAPLTVRIQEFFFPMGLIILEGYGLTETSPVVAFNSRDKYRFGSVGISGNFCDVKTDENGELMVKGDNVMLGYYNKPEATKEVLQKGWFRTGDLATIDHEGFVTITGRIKDIIVTSGGKNVAPQRIESIIGGDHFVEQILVIGDQRPYIVALIVPSFEALEQHAENQGISWDNWSGLVSDPDIVQFYKARLESYSGEFARFESIKKFALLDRNLTQEDGEVTATLKVKRHVVAKRYAKLIDQMYLHSRSD